MSILISVVRQCFGRLQNNDFVTVAVILRIIRLFDEIRENGGT